MRIFRVLERLIGYGIIPNIETLDLKIGFDKNATKTQQTRSEKVVTSRNANIVLLYTIAKGIYNDNHSQLAGMVLATRLP